MNLWVVLEVKYNAMVVQRRSHETYWVAPLRGSIPQSQLIDEASWS